MELVKYIISNAKLHDNQLITPYIFVDDDYLTVDVIIRYMRLMDNNTIDKHVNVHFLQGAVLATTICLEEGPLFIFINKLLKATIELKSKILLKLNYLKKCSIKFFKLFFI